MRVLILGVSGLIGHKLLQKLSADFEVYGVLHRSKEHYGNLSLFASSNIIENINIINFESLKNLMADVNPDVIINCIGITRRKIDLNNPLDVIITNSVFPHKLANWAKEFKKRVIHFSTDCVFDGKVGNYDETSLTTAEDLYGRTKALGEINYNHTLTIRSSFIGQELFSKTELLEWVLAQNGKQIKGFRKTFYSGVSTIFMTKVVKNIINNFPELSGIYNLAPEIPISKYDLLCIAREEYELNINLEPEDEHIHIPTLNGSKLKNEINLVVPSWKIMMSELAEEKEFYKN